MFVETFGIFPIMKGTKRILFHFLPSPSRIKKLNVTKHSFLQILWNLAAKSCLTIERSINFMLHIMVMLLKLVIFVRMVLPMGFDPIPPLTLEYFHCQPQNVYARCVALPMSQEKFGHVGWNYLWSYYIGNVFWK